MNKHWVTLSFLLLVSCLAFGQAPTGFSGTGYRTTAHLKWDNYTAFTPVGFNIYRSTVSNSFGAPARRVGAYNDYTDYGLSASTTYYYKISAFDAAGNESPVSSQITVATNGNNYLKVASLDLLIPIYTGGMAPGEPDDVRQSLEVARLFYFRNSMGQLNLKFHYLEIPGDPPPNNDGVGDFGTIGTDLHNRGILDNQYDAIHVIAYQTYGYWGGAMWLGQTAGSMAHFPGYSYNPNNHYTTGDFWVFTHEFGHSLDMLADQSGHPNMLFNHYPWAFPLPAGIPNFDIGTDYDGMAMVLRLFDKHLQYAAPWDGYFEVTDSDGDKLANFDDRLPMDEARFGSSPFTDDSDLDGLTDLKEFHAGNLSSANPVLSDTDGDGVQDGTDPYPISNFRPTVQKTTAPIAINGTMAAGEGWQPLVSNPFFTLQPGATLSASATWDDTYLYFAFQSNTPLKYYLYMDGSGEDGIFSSPIRFPGGNYNGINDAAWGDSYYESAVLIIRSDASQVILKNAPVAGSQIATANTGGTYTTEVRIPHNLGPGFGWTYTPPAAPVVTTQSYTTGDIIGVNLIALPLAGANGNETDDWRGGNFISMNEVHHYYDMTLVGGNAAAYCASTSNFPWEDWIAKVEMGSFQHPSGKSPYSDFTNQVINVAAGQSYPIKLTTGYSYFTWDEYWTVWVDFNHDGIFSSPNEVVQMQKLTAPAAGTPTATLTGSVNIPASAMTGPTRMRVSMKRGAFATPCETLPFGEVEDYTVNITTSAPLPDLAPVAWEVIPGGNNNCYTAPGSPYGYLGGLALNSTQVAITTPFVAKAWLSKDDQIGAGDILWQTFNYTGVGANTVVGINIDSPVPAATAPGMYYILVKVDADNAVAELDETNNIFNTGLQKIGAPDFALQNLTGAPGSVPVGGSINFSVQVKDLTTFPLNELTGNLTVDVVLSPDNVLGNGNDLAFATQTVNYSQFAAGTATINVSGQVAGTVTPGNYYLLLKATANCETNYLNNSLVGPQVTITTGETPGTYCASTSNFPWEDWIAKVELGNLSNASGKSNYSNFTNLTANLNAGQSYPIKLTTGYSYFTWNEHWRVWIDFNNDGVFSTPDEVVQQQILTAPAPGTATAFVTGSINIPSWATGTTRMRVSMKRGAFPSACEILPFGEVEDYTVNFTPASGCSVTFGLGNIACHDNGTPLNPLDDSFTFQIVVYGQGQFWSMTWNGGGTSGISSIVQTIGPLPISAFPNGFNFTIYDTSHPGCSTTGSMTPPLPCSSATPPSNYCTSTSNFPWEDWISRVKLGTLDNTSGKSQYSDFTALSANLQQNQSYTVTLTTGYSYFTWDEYWRVWIDFNHDGVFSTPDEIVQQRVLTAPAAGTATASVTGSINIPAGALTGPTRMRVSMKRGSYASACETLPFGEVEDYTVNITSSLTGDDTDNRAANLSFEAVPEMTWVNLAGAYHFAEPVVQIEMEKSVDGNDYEVLKTLQGKAIADNSQVVQVRDEQPNDGFNFYRMLILLENGDEVYSPVRVVSFDVPMDYAIFPNPATSEVFIQLMEAPAGEMQWNINDAYGRVVWSQKIGPDAQFPYRIDVTGFRDGMYYLFAQQPGRRAVGKRFVVVDTRH